MKPLATITLALLVFLSCSDEKIKPDRSRPQTNNNHYEKFNDFFEKFSSDSVFQKSRIKFPLTTGSYDIDTEKTSTSTIEAVQWEFFNIKKLDKKYLLNTRKENNQYIVNIQIEDTGVYVDYIFQQLGNKWMLVKIDDQST